MPQAYEGTQHTREKGLVSNNTVASPSTFSDINKNTSY